MEPDELQIGNYVIIDYGNQHDVFKVAQLNIVMRTATLLCLSNAVENQTQITNNDQWRMMFPIPFDESFIEHLGFIRDTTYEIPGVLGQGGYVFFGPNGDDVIVRYENNNWLLFYSENADGENFIRRQFLYLHEFQQLVASHWNVDYANLEAYLPRFIYEQDHVN